MNIFQKVELVFFWILQSVNPFDNHCNDSMKKITFNNDINELLRLKIDFFIVDSTYFTGVFVAGYDLPDPPSVTHLDLHFVPLINRIRPLREIGIRFLLCL